MFRKKRLYLIISLVAVLIAGMVLAQGYWIKNAYRMHQMYFDEQVQKILEQTAANTEKQIFSYNLYARSYIRPGQNVMLLKTDGKTPSADTIPLFNVFPYPDRPDTCFFTTPATGFDVLTMMDVTMRFEYRPADTTINMSLQDQQLHHLTISNYHSVLDDRSDIIRRLQPVHIDSTLHSMLLKNGIHGTYVWGIRRQGSDRFLYISDSMMAAHVLNAKYQVTMFAGRQFVTPYILQFYLKDSDKVVTNMLGWSLAGSFVIIVCLAIAFIYFISIVLRQKKFSEMKTDFINNMTHEFMTPVTNISLALETLEKNRQSASDTDKILEVIAEENEHLSDNINKVLQVALLEKGSFLLNPSVLDLHLLLQRVAKSFALQVGTIGGTIVFDFQAKQHYITADETHIINLFYNIIDNAVKYAANRPLVIHISTGNEGKYIWVKIEDNGIGMAGDTVKNIFNKFYRGSSGNRHDVKGFGLGLSYVKSIADAHGININVKSILDKGTTFTFWIKL